MLSAFIFGKKIIYYSLLCICTYQFSRNNLNSLRFLLPIYYFYRMKNKTNIQKSKKSWYDKHKNEKEFRAHRSQLTKDYIEKHPWIKEYYREYAKKYYQANKKKLNAQRKKYPDPTRNGRVNRFKQKERDALEDNYIIQLITRGGKIKKQNVTVGMIIARRKQIQEKRIEKKK